MPSQKLGMARPMLVVDEISQSMGDRCLTAASTPSGRAISTVSSSPTTANSMVAGAR